MQHLNKILLSSATGLLAMAGAQAADLPSRKSGPVSYVKICDAYGKGFFTLPGSDTCLRIAGFVRVEAQYTPGQRIVNLATGLTSQVAGAIDSTGIESRGRFDLDARTSTDTGVVRTFVRIRALNSTGIRRNPGYNNFQTSYATNGSATAITLERAFVQWQGFTFGLIGSEIAGLWPSGAIVGGVADFTSGYTNGVKGLAYTAKFGGGWTAIVEIHDRTDAGHDPQPFVAAGVAPLLVPTQFSSTYNHTPTTGFNLLGVLRYEQPWGGVEINGGVGNNSTSVGPLPNANGSAVTPLLGSQSMISWALNSTLQINLPMIAAGDAFFVNVSYGKGLLGYVTAPDSVNTLVNDAGNRRVLGGVIVNPSNIQATTATAGGAPLSFANVGAFQATALFTHYWSPQWRSHFSVAYLQLTPPTAFNPVGGLNTQLGKSSIWAVKGNIIYSPVKEFDVGVEAGYGQMRLSIQNPTAAFIAAGSPGLKEGNWTGKFRVSRFF